ncbi:MAG TPA: cation:proton antiporter [Candidatus Nanoarchaeia archaeon]|nr:cation:proton antiporter [Candidatus Nanoarchaeia archaeon]
MQFSLIIEIGLVIIFAALLANLARLFKQPLILGYVIAGVLLGPSLLGIIKNTEFIKSLSELGIAFLLFFVGMELDFSKIKKMGKLIIITGFTQIILTFLLSTVIALYWFSFIQSAYIGLIISLSSTMIVIKLLSDDNQLDTLHGRIILGILLVQDIVAMIALPLITTLDNINYIPILITITKISFLFLLAFSANRFVFKHLVKITAKSHELLFITAIAICFLFSGIAYILDFSIAIGAFLAGISLATFPYNLEIEGRVKSLKDFFVIIFFVILGTQVTLINISDQIIPIIIFTLIVLLIKPLIIFTTLKFFKQGNRTSFITSISLAQISEFSLILAAIGLTLNHLNQEIFNIVIIISLFTITLTSYIINYDEKIYSLFSKYLIPLEKFTSKKNLENIPKGLNHHIILFGAHRMGSKIILKLIAVKKKFIVIDYNPEVIKKLISDKINCIYGDIANVDLLEQIGIEKAKLIISTIPKTSDNLLLLEITRKKNKKAIVFVTAQNAEEAVILYQNSADFVALPELIAGIAISELLNNKKIIKKTGKELYKQLLKDKKTDKLMW